MGQGKDKTIKLTWANTYLIFSYKQTDNLQNCHESEFKIFQNKFNLKHNLY